MKRILHYMITEKENDMNVKDYLKNHGYSHAVFVQLKKTLESIMVNDRWYYMKDKLHAGDCITVTIDEKESSSNIQPVYYDLDIVYEDADILVVNKPFNMPIHPSMKNYENTLANAVMYYYTSRQIPYTFRCVNRLDRDTSGLTILASHMLSSAVLYRQMKNREIHRIYIAIVEGEIDGCGTIDAPIARKDGSTIERVVDFQNGEHAITHYKKIAYQNGLSMVAVWLETGRTHQIRVHMKYIGHPLIGDFLYNSKNHVMSRQALHSYRLIFTHPVTEQELTFTAPLPDDMRQIFDISNEELQSMVPCDIFNTSDNNF